MRDLLLDTNIWSYWFAPESYPEQYTNIQKNLKKIASSARLSISIVSWGEIDYGYNVNHKKGQSRETEFRNFMNGITPWLVPIDRDTAKEYGKLRAGLFEKYVPRVKRSGFRPCQIVDPVTSLELGIQENDLWIAAQAISRNLTLVTNDKMAHIKKIAGKSLHVDNWA